MTDAQTHDLLVELGCEELPPKALAKLAEAFFEACCAGLEAAGITFARERSRYYYTPRRMALLLCAVAGQQPDRTQERRGPALSAAFDEDGKPTAAAIGFARSVGKDVAQLDRIRTGKGEWLGSQQHVPGQGLGELLYPLLQEVLDGLPVPRPMRWSDHDFSFVRPVHWLLVLHGEQVLDGVLYGCRAGRETRAHRIHAPGPHSLASPDDYLAVLRKGRVEADQQQRRTRIAELAREQGNRSGGQTRITPELLDEVTNLVEWPVAVTCHFDPAFLEVPAEALIASMEGHQKFFPVLGAAEPGQTATLTPAFVVIANIESIDVSQMIEGFERVVQPRLADARFFWQQDLKSSLTEQAKPLDKVIFQKDLGTIGDKSRRIAEISEKIAELIGADAGATRRAALLAKADLNSLMVGEFPELQGIMGAHHARAEGEPAAVAEALASHYLPRFAGDAIPADVTGQLVGLADRLDTLVGVFATGLKPTGSKDPFALRRAALGLIRILLEAHIDVPLDRLLGLAADALQQQISISAQSLADVRQFILERLRHYCMELGATTQQVNAVLSAPVGSLDDFAQRLAAVGSFMQLADSVSLVAANKRIGNILRKQGQEAAAEVDSGLFTLKEEEHLFAELERISRLIGGFIEARDYQSALAQLALLRPVVDAYFEQVLVMDEDPAIRANRLATLGMLKAQFDRIADFSQSD